ncbi:hypothetical protein [Candidatus Methanoprimaticola sp. MG2]|uniref:hypothetical protein n=1 Tax=Candidatus Methanoprimaticola sp. MG2 TaxID=3228838 RepID=UPI0039C65F29
MKEITEHGNRNGVDFRKVLVVMAAVCMMFTLVPMVDAAGADDTMELQNLINGSTTTPIELDKDYSISSTVSIGRTLTIDGNGHSITYSGNQSALKITGGATVALKSLTINATTSGAYGITITSNESNVTLQQCTVNANNRGVSYYPTDGCTGKTLTIDNTDILNSQISNYDNDTTVGDTRGIALYGVTDSQINIINGSAIKGFGYSINTSNGLANGVRAGGNTYTVTDSVIVGWSAFNVWTVGNTFNITNSTLKGISDLSGDWNNFATIVFNDGIYNGVSGNANILNIYGGTVAAFATGTAMHSAFLESSESITQIHFYKYNNIPVLLYFPEESSAFRVTYPGTTVNYTGIENVLPAYSD